MTKHLAVLGQDPEVGRKLGTDAGGCGLLSCLVAIDWCAAAGGPMWSHVVVVGDELVERFPPLRTDTGDAPNWGQRRFWYLQPQTKQRRACSVYYKVANSIDGPLSSTRTPGVGPPLLRASSVVPPCVTHLAYAAGAQPDNTPEHAVARRQTPHRLYM